MTRMLRLAGITLVALALTGAIAVSTRVDGPSPAGPSPARVAADPARPGVEAASGDVEAVAWSRNETRRNQTVGARVDALLLPTGVLAAALLALGAVSTATRRSTARGGLRYSRGRAPPVLLLV
jgi:hypothetical protein